MDGRLSQRLLILSIAAFLLPPGCLTSEATQIDSMPYELSFKATRKCTPVPPEVKEIPSCIRELADEFLIYMLGENRFHTAVEFNDSASHRHLPWDSCYVMSQCTSPEHSQDFYLLKYAINLTVGDANAAFPVGIAMTTDGHLLPDTLPSGVPPCAHEPAECTLIPLERAETLARDLGLAPGTEPWGFSLHFNEGQTRETRTYVWQVTDNLYPPSSSMRKGEVILLDASSGELFHRGDYSEQP